MAIKPPKPTSLALVVAQMAPVCARHGLAPSSAANLAELFRDAVGVHKLPWVCKQLAELDARIDTFVQSLSKSDADFETDLRACFAGRGIAGLEQDHLLSKLDLGEMRTALPAHLSAIAGNFNTWYERARFCEDDAFRYTFAQADQTRLEGELITLYANLVSQLKLATPDCDAENAAQIAFSESSLYAFWEEFDYWLYKTARSAARAKPLPQTETDPWYDPAPSPEEAEELLDQWRERLALARLLFKKPESITAIWQQMLEEYFGLRMNGLRAPFTPTQGVDKRRLRIRMDALHFILDRVHDGVEKDGIGDATLLHFLRGTYGRVDQNDEGAVRHLAGLARIANEERHRAYGLRWARFVLMTLKLGMTVADAAAECGFGGAGAGPPRLVNPREADRLANARRHAGTSTLPIPKPVRSAHRRYLFNLAWYWKTLLGRDFFNGARVLKLTYSDEVLLESLWKLLP